METTGRPRTRSKVYDVFEDFWNDGIVYDGNSDFGPGDPDVIIALTATSRRKDGQGT